MIKDSIGALKVEQAAGWRQLRGQQAASGKRLTSGAPVSAGGPALGPLPPCRGCRRSQAQQ